MKFNIQLFATTSKKQTGGSTSVTSSSSTSGTTSSSSSTGGSQTVTDSMTKTSSQGGSHSDSSGKSWASGEVDSNTMLKNKQYSQDYQQGQNVQEAYQRLQEGLTDKPSYKSQYEGRLNELYNSIMGRGQFSYNFNSDPMYQMYKDQYVKQGEDAMKSTMGQAQAMTGGYGNTYAQSVGQQAYQNYLQQLNDKIPQLREQAYQEWKDEGDRQKEMFDLTGQMSDSEYAKYRDSMADYQSDRAYNQSAYEDERNFDYNQYANERDYWNNEYWKERNAEQSQMSSSDASTWENSVSQTKAISNSTNWSNALSSSNSYSNNTSTTNTTNWQDTSSTEPDESLSAYASALNEIKKNLEGSPWNMTKKQMDEAKSDLDVVVEGFDFSNPSIQSSYANQQYKEQLKKAGYTDTQIAYFEEAAKQLQQKSNNNNGVSAVVRGAINGANI